MIVTRIDYRKENMGSQAKIAHFVQNLTKIEGLE